MKFGTQNRHIIDLVFSLGLFCVFAATAFLVVTLGANVYQSTVSTMEENFSGRTALSYVAEKIRQNDSADSVSLTQIGDTPALRLLQTLDDEEYATYIYYTEGCLRELFTRMSLEPSLEAGQTILELDSFSVRQVQENLYQFTVTDEKGRPVSLYISPRCGAAAERSQP